MNASGSSRTSVWAWVAITTVVWPVWHRAATSLIAYPLSWVASRSTSVGVPAEPGGVFDSAPQSIALALVGLVFGLLGVYLLRLVGAPRIVWLPAAAVSMLAYLVTTLFWAGFSGAGTGLGHQAGQFAIAAALGATFGLGAWVGSRIRKPAERARPADAQEPPGGRVSESAAVMWSEFLASGSPAASSAIGASYSAWQFGHGVEQGDRLLECVLAGPKRATAGALWAYEAEAEPVPVPGDFSIVLDGHGDARCVIRTVSVDIVPFDEVDASFAFDEGEGDRTLGYWRDVHWTYFARELEALGTAATHDMPVVCERFEVVYPVGLEALA